MNWLSEAIEKLASVVPRIGQVQANEAGIKFVRGNAVELEPGLFFYWPLVTTAEVLNNTRQILSVGPLTLETLDHKTITCTGVIAYLIPDIYAYLVENENSEDGIDEVAQAAMRDVITSMEKEDVTRGGKVLDNRLTRAASQDLRSFGVEVESLRLQSCAEGLVIIHTGSSFEPAP